MSPDYDVPPIVDDPEVPSTPEVRPVTKSDYMGLIGDMIDKRKALDIAINAMFKAVESGVLNDPPKPKGQV